MTTFHEMLNTVSFRNMAGKVDGHEDLWALRDLLYERMVVASQNSAMAYAVCMADGQDSVAISVRDDYMFFIERLEKDIMTIEQYCKKRGIIRPRE